MSILMRSICFRVLLSVSVIIMLWSYKFSKVSLPSLQLKSVDLKYLWTYKNYSDYTLNLEILDQTDTELIEYAKENHLSPPSNLPYNFEKHGTTKDIFSGWVAKFFRDMRNGTFIEVGANSGEDASHSLYLEKELGWTGLLIECHPNVVPVLKSKNRKAWIADACLSPTGYAAKLNFSIPVNWTFSATLGKPWKLPTYTKSSEWKFVEVQALPLFTILAAISLKEVDYFSFDIEGQELAVLRNFPFHLVSFKVIIIEVYFYSTLEIKELDELLESHGYFFVKKMDIDNIYVNENYRYMIPPE